VREGIKREHALRILVRSDSEIQHAFQGSEDLKTICRQLVMQPNCASISISFHTSMSRSGVV
jgi:hypothetical protein